MRDVGLYPDVNAPLLYVNGAHQSGGYVSSSDLFSIAAESGTIYYTINGNDPRLPGGAVNTSDATEYAEAFSIGMSRHIKARAKVGQTWSVLNEAVTLLIERGHGDRCTDLVRRMLSSGSPGPCLLYWVCRHVDRKEYWESVSMRDLLLQVSIAWALRIRERTCGLSINCGHSSGRRRGCLPRSSC